MLTLLRNCFLVDGTGAPGAQRDVLIQDERILDIGLFSNAKADRIFDMAGFTIVPGFVDVNVDSDHYFTLFTDPGQKSLLAQGVTSIVGGNSGTSLAPLLGDGILSLRKWADPTLININWTNLKELFMWLQKQKTGINFGTLLGYSTIRRGLLGDSLLPLSGEDYKRFIYLIEQGLMEGALGVSVGLAYTRASTVSAEELFETTKVLSKKRGVFSCYPRAGGRAVEGVQEVLAIALDHDLNLELAHLATPRNDDFRTILETIEDASKSISIHFDLSPYHIGVKPLFSLLPHWATQRGFAQLLHYLRDNETRSRIINELEHEQMRIGKIVVAFAKNQWIIHGKTIQEIAENQSIRVVEALLKILQISENQVMGFMEDGEEALREELLFHPLSLISSNGVGYDHISMLGRPKIHPRSFAAFPRFLRLAREGGKISFEESIQKVTQLPASKYNLKKRGAILPGNFADLVVLDQSNVKEENSYEKPDVHSSGIIMVFVNGVLSYERGTFLDTNSGKIISSSSN